MLALVVATPAGAATPPTALATVTAGVFTGPALAGDRVVWASSDLSGHWEVSTATPGAAPELLADLAPPTAGSEGANQYVTVSASDRVVALGDEGETVENSRYGHTYLVFNRLLAARWGEPLAELGDLCTSRAANGMPGPVAVDGARVASLTLCADGRLAFEVRDLDAPGGASLAVDVDARGPFAVTDVRLRGGLLAWQEDRGVRKRIVVADLRSGVRRVAWEGRSRPDAWDLRADGAVAAVVSDRNFTDAPRRFGWADAAGTWHPLPQPARGPVRFVGDTIATVLWHGPRRNATDTRRRSLALIGLDGGVRTVARFRGGSIFTDLSVPSGLDFDGTAVAWGERQCDTVTVHRVALAELDEPVRAAGRRACPQPHVVGSRATVARDGRVALRVTCSEPCRGIARLSPKAGRTVSTRFALPGGPEPQRIVLRLRPRDVARVAGRRRLAATAELSDRQDMGYYGDRRVWLRAAAGSR